MKVVVALPAIFGACIVLMVAASAISGIAELIEDVRELRAAYLRLELQLEHETRKESAKMAVASSRSTNATALGSQNASIPSQVGSRETADRNVHESLYKSKAERLRIQQSQKELAEINEQAARKIWEEREWLERRNRFRSFLGDECPMDVIPQWADPDGYWIEHQSPTRFEDKELWIGEGINVSEFFRVAPSGPNTRFLVVGDSHMDAIYSEIRLQLTAMGLNYSHHLHMSWNYKLGRNAAKMLYLGTFQPTHILLGRGTWDGPVNNKNTIIHSLKEGLIDLGRAFHGVPIVFAGVRHIAKLPRVVKESRKLGAKCFNQNHLRNRWTKCECYLDNTPMLRLAYFHAVKLANMELTDLGFERSALIRFANCENITKLLVRPLGKYSRDGSHLGIISPPQLVQTHFLLQRLLSPVPDEVVAEFDAVPNCTVRSFFFFRDAHVCPWTKIEDSPGWQVQQAEVLAKKMDSGETFCGEMIEFVSRVGGEPADYLAAMRHNSDKRYGPFLDHLDKCLRLAKQIGRPQLQEISNQWDLVQCENVTSWFRFVPHQKVEAIIRGCNQSEKILANFEEAQWEALGIAPVVKS